MVWANFDDFGSPKKTVLEKVKNKRLANPTDRIGAFFIDALISYGFSSFLASPVSKLYTEAQVLGEYGRVLIYAISLFAIHFSFYVAFNSFLSYRYQKTFGQRFFNIRSISIWSGKTPSLGKIILRNIAFFFGAPLLLPLTGMFTDNYRRMFFDKLTDTIMISEGRSYSGAPSKQERSFVKGLLLPAYLWVFALIASAMSTGAEMLLEEDDWLTRLNNSIPHCEEVVELSKDWPQENNEKTSRLMIALSLYASEQVSKECLLSEADAAFLRKKEITYAYLAKAFALEGVVELSDDYLVKVCEHDSQTDACLFTKLINYWADSDYKKADRVVDVLMDNSYSFMKAYAIQHYMNRKQFKSAYELIEKLSINPYLNNFLSKYRSKALWNLGRESEAEIAFVASQSKLHPRDLRQQQAWLCWKNLEVSCHRADKAVCQGMNQWVYNTEEEFTDIEALAMFNKNECSGDMKQGDLLNSLAHRVSPASKIFFSYIEQNRTTAMHDLLEMSLAGKISGELSHELVKRLLANNPSETSLLRIHQYLMITNRYSQEWESSIIKLTNAYYDRGMNQQAESLAETALAMVDQNPYFHRSLAINAFEKSQSNWLKKFIEPFSQQSRAPASADKSSSFIESSNVRFKEVMQRLQK